jgi:glycosyltransferase involved in cell wall biosynthesis
MNLSIIIPAYNEGRHVDAVIRRLHEAIGIAEPSFEIVLVNNGSTDETPSVVKALADEFSNVRVIDVYPNEGYGNGILKGLAASTGNVLGWVHADEQSKPENLVIIYRRMLQEGNELGKAVRVERYESRWRIIQSKAYNLLFRAMFGLSYRDINGTPKLMTRSFYDRATLSSRQWFIDPEVMLKASEMNASVGEIEIIWDARKEGKSKVHLTTMFHFLHQMMLFRFRKRFKTYV